MSLSWFQLERYALGEVSDADRAQIEAALASDETARARLAEIRAAPLTKTALPRLRERRSWSRDAWLALAASIAVAISVLLLQVTNLESKFVGVKGDAFSVALVRQHEGAVAPEPSRLVIGDKYSVLVTCVPPRDTSVRVQVRQNGELAEPFGGAVAVQCANSVALPDALVFDAMAPAEICVSDPSVNARECISVR
jgi:hypothetical protein